MCYGKPPFAIPEHLWNRELRLWACDQAEPSLCHVKDTEREICEQALQVARNFSNGKARIGDLDLMTEATSELGKNSQLESSNESSRYFALWAVNYAVRSPYDKIPNTAHYAARYAATSLNKMTTQQLMLQKVILFKRIDLIAPWANPKTNLEESIPHDRILDPTR